MSPAPSIRHSGRARRPGSFGPMRMVYAASTVPVAPGCQASGPSLLHEVGGGRDASPLTCRAPAEGEKRIGHGFWLLLRDPMTAILDIDGQDVGGDLPEVITDDRSEAAGTADAEDRHGQL